MIISISKRDN